MICPLFGFNGAKPSTIGFHSYERHDHAYTPRTNGAKHSNIGFQPYERDPRSRRPPMLQRCKTLRHRVFNPMR